VTLDLPPMELGASSGLASMATGAVIFCSWSSHCFLSTITSIGTIHPRSGCAVVLYLAESVMFVRVSSHNPNEALDEFGAAGSSVSLDEIIPGQGTAIFVE